MTAADPGSTFVRRTRNVFTAGVRQRPASTFGTVDAGLLAHVDPLMDHGQMAEDDPRARYRQLPPVTDPDDLIETVDTDDEVDLPPDPNEGAAPYLRVTWGPWVR